MSPVKDNMLGSEVKAEDIHQIVPDVEINMMPEGHDQIVKSPSRDGAVREMLKSQGSQGSGGSGGINIKKPGTAASQGSGGSGGIGSNHPSSSQGSRKSTKGALDSITGEMKQMISGSQQASRQPTPEEQKEGAKAVEETITASKEKSAMMKEKSQTGTMSQSPLPEMPTPAARTTHHHIEGTG